MYQVIARKYRPQGFAELIGQEHVQKTLANAIESNRIAHGYIFSGQRGTGKTTVARILARCLNCVQGPTAKPCGVCSSCTEISSGSSPDVIEIDAASNRGINEMREIRENVRYRPARDRFKVFIVDEAHQITKEAFNALLKTLEEPPDWVVFILCTTEANEIPNTIASRCQHFTFRSVDFEELMARMRFIAGEEGITAGDEALSVLARAGEGSVRDALSALDQAIACCGNTLGVEQIRVLLGVFGTDSLEAVAEAVKSSDGGRMLEIVAELENSGLSLQHFSRELSRFWRNLLVAKISGKPTRLIAASDEEQARLLQAAEGFNEEDLTRFLNLSLKLYKDLQSSLQPRLHLELGLIKLVHAGRMQSIEEALAGLGPAQPRSGEQSPAQPRSGKSSSGDNSPPPPKPGETKTATARTTAPRPPALQAPAVAATVESPATLVVEEAEVKPASDLKSQLFQALSQAGLKYSADAIGHSEVALNGGELAIQAPKAMLLSLRDAATQKVMLQAIGKPVKVRLEAGGGAASGPSANAPSAEPPEQMDEVRQRALAHPSVKQFQELFPGAQVRNVRNLSE